MNLSKCKNFQKNAAWRRLKAVAPGAAAAMQRDLPALEARFGRMDVYVPAAWVPKNKEGGRVAVHVPAVFTEEQE